MATNRQLIQDKAVDLLKASYPAPMRYTPLVKGVHSALPQIPLNTVHGSVWDLQHSRSEVVKPAKGLFLYNPNPQAVPLVVVPVPAPSPKIREEDFYGPFADFLKGDLDECIEAVAIGGNVFGQRWGTPDVVGIYRPGAADIVKFAPEIVSAEIKIDPRDPVTAFGQAVAYRLYSTKSYLVEPNTISPDDLERVEALCIHHGIGLILFEPDAQNPNFEIRVRAQKVVPDMYWVNDFAEKMKNRLPTEFKQLFP